MTRCAYCREPVTDALERRERFGAVIVECETCWREAGRAKGWALLPELIPVKGEGDG